jgi:hypothetical protein
MHKYKHLDDSSVWVIPPNYDSRPEPETIFFSAWGVGMLSAPLGFFGFSYLLTASSST